MLQGFKKFLLKGNVLDLAVAVVIGAAFGNVITAFVKDLLTPLIAAIGGQPDFSALSLTVNNSRFMYGDFLNALISFLIVGAAVYFFVVVPVGRMMALAESREKNVREAMLAAEADVEGVEFRKCPECLSDVPVQARRCAHCTAVIGPVASLKTGT